MTRSEQLSKRSFEEEEWQKLFYKYQQQYIRRRLEAIKYLHDGKSRQEVMDKIGCARQTLITWIDKYCQGGLKALVTPIKSKRIQRLSSEQKEEIKRMLLEKKPTDYGIDRQIWTGKIIIEVVQQRWGIELKDSRTYDILKEMGLSHQKAHRDYENSDPKVQKEFVTTIKKNWQN
ncbi:MAG: winged helix-turn-helix domain-containing protein [Dolichospermum sp.]|uniref:winged helix-turn-helix domain-containing protein n=1 Tax=Dolichospermum sp. UHCC 0259 TaxID=2590010 RepID=UPI001444E8A5|nr:winged helix-turn-helix domain-containing protein [Dolichospermum sp. UHCC 0259]MDP5016592.1 winged helix-turn-helix domain-containing protein [Dolichospermum sp.]